MAHLAGRRHPATSRVRPPAPDAPGVAQPRHCSKRRDGEVPVRSKASNIYLSRFQNLPHKSFPMNRCWGGTASAVPLPVNENAGFSPWGRGSLSWKPFMGSALSPHCNLHSVKLLRGQSRKAGSEAAFRNRSGRIFCSKIIADPGDRGGLPWAASRAKSTPGAGGD